MTILIYLLWLLVAVILQVFLFGHLSLFGGVVFIYTVALLKLPVEMTRVSQIFLGFLVGLVLDLFCNTLGMNALATVTLMLLRDPILHLYNNDPEFKDGVVGADKIGLSTNIRFALTIIVLHATLLYVIESFTLFNIPLLFTKVLISSLLTFTVALALEFTTMKR